MGCSKKASPDELTVQKPQWREVASIEVPSALTLSSPAFEDGKPIPKKYSCQGPAVSPPLTVESVPQKAQSLVLIMSDPDAPLGEFSHWILWNIPVNATLEEGKYPKGATQGLNDGTKHDYFGPCPPSGTHQYAFKLYALDTTLDLDHNSQQRDVEEAMKGHVLAKTALVGTYQKDDTLR
ncbi:YbhB/YbcL family Raf kinase inhibitor-like protein [Candidatus Woesearchaeota archaeon]|nr:YbhB/YbcL family Raf kinase inhibitor-like protein [Candidatus Woesearchaeota archaeon]